MTAMFTILARTQPCTCGCKGRDPWHARTFDREVRGVCDATGEAADGSPIYRTGVARFPWGTETVEEVGRVGFTSRWWRIAR